MTKIIEIAHLVEFLMRKDVSNSEKAAAIKMARTDGIITDDEALDLTIEYTH